MAKDCQPQQKITAVSAIILEAGLSFLGLGDPTLMSLGSLASNAQRFLRVAWWMVLFPGATIAAAAVGFGLLGDALNEALQTRTKDLRGGTPTSWWPGWALPVLNTRLR